MKKYLISCFILTFLILYPATTQSVEVEETFKMSFRLPTNLEYSQTTTVKSDSSFSGLFNLARKIYGHPSTWKIKEKDLKRVDRIILGPSVSHQKIIIWVDSLLIVNKDSLEASEATYSELLDYRTYFKILIEHVDDYNFYRKKIKDGWQINFKPKHGGAEWRKGEIIVDSTGQVKMVKVETGKNYYIFSFSFKVTIIPDNYESYLVPRSGLCEISFRALFFSWKLMIATEMRDFKISGNED